MTSESAKDYRYILFAVPAVIFGMDLLLAAASTSSNLLDRYLPVLMVLNVATVALLAVTIIGLCARIFLEWRRRRFGSQMTMRLTLQMSAIAIIPCLLLFAVSSRFIGRSIDTWFNVRVEHALDSGVSLSRSAIANYQKQVTERAALLGDSLSDLPRDEWRQELGRLRERYGLTDVMVTNSKGDIVSSDISDPAAGMKKPSSEIFVIAARQGSYSALLEGDPVGDLSVEAVRILAITPVKKLVISPQISFSTFQESLARLPDSLTQQRSLRSASYFVVALESLPESLETNISSVMNGYKDYQGLVLGREGLRSLFTTSLTVSMLLAVLGTVVAVIAFAQIMTDPLRQLARGTKKVAGGNLSPIREFSGSDEINVLTQYFNDMIGQLAEAQKKVQLRTEELEQTSQFLKSVLANLSSGVVVVDSEMNIVTANDGAARLFGNSVLTSGTPLSAVAPKVCSTLLDAALEISRPLADPGPLHREIEVDQDSGMPATLFVRASRIFLAGRTEPGMVLVIDDMTQVISAQRTIAWGEVARRLAHEIKNPLTPIQLAAERLEMKLSDKLGPKDANLLTRSISTIVTQVTAMKQMVNDFREYAKLPPAVLLPTNLNRLLEDVALLYHDAGKPVTIQSDPSIPEILADEAQLRQILHNLVGNAMDALQQREDGRIVVSTERREGEGGTADVALTVSDNGPGFAPSILHKSFEPYVTTKATGSGLGLPMVKKIVDEHRAEISISNRTDPDGQVVGAQVRIIFRGRVEERPQKIA